MSQAHFDLETVLDRSFKQKGTMTIDRDSGMVTIRPLHSRRAYVVPLNDVATMIVQRAIKQEVAEGKRNKPTRRKMVSRGLLTAGR